MTRTRKVAAAALSVLALSITAAPIASADPAFGPGNKGGGEGNSGPQVGKCHPPGQTTGTPGCK
jgi:Spy/CpxP family protein refolding chaperone